MAILSGDCEKKTIEDVGMGKNSEREEENWTLRPTPRLNNSSL